MADLFTLFGTIAINSTVANETIDGTMEKVANLTGTLQSVGTQSEKSLGSGSKFGAASVWAGNMFTKLAVKAAEVGKKAFGIGMNYNAGIETAGINLTTLLKGDEEAADNLIEKLTELAKATPLGASGLISNAKELLSYGIELEDIIPTLKMLGDFAFGNQTKLDGIVRAYGQIYSQQQLMAQDANQLVNQDVPIFQILSEHEGGKWEGMTRGDMIGDKDNPVSFEDMKAAMEAATSEGGKFYNAMFSMADSYQGQIDKLGEEGAETLGNLMKPLFESLSNETLPRILDSLSSFSTWVDNNKESIENISNAIGGLVASGFDKILSLFQWILDNSERVAVALGVISTAMVIGAIAAHPYAAAIIAVAAGLAALSGTHNYGEEYFGKYTQEDLDILQQYIDAQNKLREAETHAAVSQDWQSLLDQQNAQNEYDAAKSRLDAIEGLYSAYRSWLTTQGYSEDMPLLDVPVTIADDSESVIQGELNGLDLNATVKLMADTSGIERAAGMLNISYDSADGSHANGLESVPFDGYRAILHKREAVLTASQADAWRSGSMGGADVGRLEAAINNLSAMMQQVVANTGRGQTIVLDSGVLVGQLAPQMDTRLGTIANRKGRRNG